MRGASSSVLYNRGVFMDRRLNKLAFSEAFGLAAAVICGLASGLMAIVQALLLSRIVDYLFLRGAGLAEILPFLGALAAAAGMRFALGLAGEWTSAGLAGTIKTRLRERLLVKLRRLGPLGLSQVNAGETAALVTRGVEQLETYFTQFLPQVFLAGLIPLGILLFVFPLDPLSGLVLVLTGPLIPLFMYLIGSNAETLTGRQFARLRSLSAGLFDLIRGLPTLKGLGRTREALEQVRRLSTDYRDATLQVLRVTFLSALALEWLGTISTAVIAVQIGLRLLYGKLEFADAFFLLVIAPDFYQPLRNLGLRFHAAMQGMSAAKDIFAFLGQPDYLPADPVKRAPFPVEWQELALKNLGYRYPGDRQEALQGIDMTIRRGQRLALVGASGAGKSTLAALLTRMLIPGSGSIVIGGVDQNSIASGDWWRNVLWLPQHPYLAGGNLGDYFRVVNKNLPDEAILAGIDAVGLRSRLGTGKRVLDQPLGEEGRGFSAGEVRRLALARAMLHPAEFIVMDEPLRHVDPLESAALLDAMETLWRGRTVICIAHHLQVIERMDQVVFLERGRLVGFGGHADLMAGNPAYRAFIAGTAGQP